MFLFYHAAEGDPASAADPVHFLFLEVLFELW
jgi:hypothetical protein